MKIGEVKRIANDNYLILDILDYDNKTYYFLNKLDSNNDVSEIHELYRVVDTVFIKEKDEEILNKILPIVQEDLINLTNEITED